MEKKAVDINRLIGSSILALAIQYFFHKLGVKGAYFYPKDRRGFDFLVGIALRERLSDLKFRDPFIKLSNTQAVWHLFSDLAKTLGQDPKNPKTREAIASVTKMLTPLLPYLSYVLPSDVYSSLFPESLSPLAEQILQAHHIEVPNSDIVQRAAMIAAIMKTEASRYGLNMHELGEAYKEAVDKGLISINSHLNNVVEVAKIYAIGKMAYPKQPEKIFDLVDALKTKHPGMPLSSIADELSYLNKLKYLGGSESAAIRRLTGGFPGKGATPLKTIEELDEKLKQRAVQSPLGNIAGAIIRLHEKGIRTGPIGELAARIKNGKPIPLMTIPQFVSYAARSGVNPGLAVTIATQKAANRSAIKREPMYVLSLRRSQLSEVLARVHLLRMAYGNSPAAQLIIEGELARLADKYGYSSLDAMLESVWGPAVSGEQLAALRRVSGDIDERTLHLKLPENWGEAIRKALEYGAEGSFGEFMTPISGGTLIGHESELLPKIRKGFMSKVSSV